MAKKKNVHKNANKKNIISALIKGYDIESLNSTCKKLNRQRAVFPNDKALPKSLYLETLQDTKK